jgi:hypothetical protein
VKFHFPTHFAGSLASCALSESVSPERMQPAASSITSAHGRQAPLGGATSHPCGSAKVNSPIPQRVNLCYARSAICEEVYWKRLALFGYSLSNSHCSNSPACTSEKKCASECGRGRLTMSIQLFVAFRWRVMGEPCRIERDDEEHVVRRTPRAPSAKSRTAAAGHSRDGHCVVCE